MYLQYTRYGYGTSVHVLIYLIVDLHVHVVRDHVTFDGDFQVRSRYAPYIVNTVSQK